MKQKVLFVDHSFHEKTLSSAFFMDALREEFDVDLFYLSPSMGIDQTCLEAAAASDYVLLWQMDFLAPIFLAMGKQVVVLPMYDGSANQPALHWLAQCRATQINFSLRMHAYVARFGVRSHLVRYYKPPVAAAKRASFDGGLRVFLWQRRPEHGINVAAVEALLGEQITYLHVHDAPDDAKVDSSEYMLRRIRSYDFSSSKWFQTKGDYLDIVSRCNTFVCPRRAEGIGMALLESLARGMLVLAADEATHNEYISNWTNGILFDPDSPSPASLGDRAAAIGYQAWKGAEIGYECWLSQLAGVPDFIRGTAVPPVVISDMHRLQDLADDLVASYYSGDAYVDFLNVHLPLIEQLSGLNQESILKLVGDKQR